MYCGPPNLKTWLRAWCQVQPSQKERSVSAVHCKNEGMLLEPFSWRCTESVIFICSMHENDQT